MRRKPSVSSSTPYSIENQWDTRSPIWISSILLSAFVIYKLFRNAWREVIRRKKTYKKTKKNPDVKLTENAYDQMPLWVRDMSNLRF